MLEFSALTFRGKLVELVEVARSEQGGISFWRMNEGDRRRGC